MAVHNELGKKGEIEARAYLESQGFEIIEQNWRSGKYELDVIARQGDTIVIAEVRTRTGANQNIEEIMSFSKENNLRQAADLYMETREDFLDCRIDVLLLSKENSGFAINHIVDAVSPG